MSWVLLAGAAVLLWLASKQSPIYRKVYLETRGDGSFRTDYSPGVEQYLESVEREVGARLVVGPISPVDDLHARLYHPELASNWQRELSGPWLGQKVKDALSGVVYVVATLFVADAAARLLTHRSGLITSGRGDAFEKLVAVAFAIALLVWLNRRKDADERTQGYLDGWSDCCAKTIQRKR